MFLKMKNKISALMQTVSEMLEVLGHLNDPLSAIEDCLAACHGIQNQLEKEKTLPDNTLNLLKHIQKSLELYSVDIRLLNEETIKELNTQLLLLISTFEEEVKIQLNIVFFPYKASMWDSLASVYESAVKDPDCIVKVVPIPYFLLNQNSMIPTYEGNLFPKDIPITHFNEYNLDEEQPDIIFVHNIYDNYNTLTRVPEMYYTSNLKRYTDMLVYIPYHISSFINPKENEHRLAYSIPSINNVDKIILVSDSIRDAAIREGIPEEKLLVLGSPKFDAMVKTINNEISYPTAWKDKITGKTVYLINTGCLYFADQPYLKLEVLMNFLNIPRIVENSVIIWRPHPLTKISIMKYTPDFLDYYLNLTENYISGGDDFYSHIIFDESEDYFPALKAADVLITSEGSLLRSFLLTEKKVLFWDEKLPEESLLPPNVFYFAFDRNEPWYELVKKFANGYDPLAENRKGVAAKVYTNTDGTSGVKTYQAIKKCLLGN